MPEQEDYSQLRAEQSNTGSLVIIQPSHSSLKSKGEVNP